MIILGPDAATEATAGAPCAGATPLGVRVSVPVMTETVTVPHDK